DRSLGRRAFGRQDDDLTELRGVLKRANRRFAAGFGPQLVALACSVGPDGDVVAVLDETVGERLPGNTGSDDANFGTHDELQRGGRAQAFVTGPRSLLICRTMMKIENAMTTNSMRLFRNRP